MKLVIRGSKPLFPSLAVCLSTCFSFGSHLQAQTPSAPTVPNVSAVVPMGVVKQNPLTLWARRNVQRGDRRKVLLGVQRYVDARL